MRRRTSERESCLQGIFELAPGPQPPWAPGDAVTLEPLATTYMAPGSSSGLAFSAFFDLSRRTPPDASDTIRRSTELMLCRDSAG